MRKLYIIAATAAIMTGCSSFLNVENLGKSTIQGFFADTDGLEAAGLGLHRTIMEFYDDDYLRMGDVPGDKAYLFRVNTSQTVQLIHDFGSSPADNSGYPYLIWRDGYTICTNANNILFYGESLYDSFPEYKELIDKNFGYAYFARALSIFELCNVYSMPYDHTSDASHPGVVAIDYVPGFDAELPRNTVKECYDLVLSDLYKALDYLGDDGSTFNPNYISGLACKALLARVYLYMKDYDNAARYAEEVMARIPLTPREDYVNMFRRAQDYPGEGILRLNSYDTGNSMKNLCSPLGSQSMAPADEFIATFTDDDIRKQLFTFVGEAEDGEEYEGKVYTAVCKYLPFKSGVSTAENRRCDPFVLRVSEMYLIHAEAKCLGSSDLRAAADDIKALRARALGRDVSEISLAYTGKEGLDQLIQEERAKELCFEGHRFFDLKRRGEDIIRPASTSSTMKRLSYPDYRFCLPISQREMQTNDYMTQNEGYE